MALHNAHKVTTQPPIFVSFPEEQPLLPSTFLQIHPLFSLRMRTQLYVDLFRFWQNQFLLS